MLFATNELVASTMLVPPSRFGPPESPKQVPPLLECSLMNSSLIELLLATRVVAAKNRVAESPGDFLQFGSHGPPPFRKFCTPYPTTSTLLFIARLSTRFRRGRAPYWPIVAAAGTGPHRKVLTDPIGVVQPGSPKMITALSWVSNPGNPPLPPMTNCGSK